MHWYEWSEETFERARASGTPILLFLRAAWCRWCRELEERVLADPRVRLALVERVLPVMVDKDRRPDIDVRYRRGGWPTLTLLDADGALLATGNYMEADELLALLEHAIARDPLPVAVVDEERKAPAPEPHAPGAPRRGARLSIELVDEIRDHLIQTADPLHGGWGARHKFPHPEALHFLIVRWTQTGHQPTLELVLRTLRQMQQGEIHDRVEGGFYRYATQPDWSVPHHEKMLDSNAKRLLSYVEAYQALGDASFRATAEGIVGWMLRTLLDAATGAFHNSQDSDPTYAHLKTLEARARRAAPATDPTIFTNYNASAAIALLKASLVLERPDLTQAAEDVLEFLMEHMWEPRLGMYHYWDGTYNLPGMLTDQAMTLRALVEVMHYAGDNRFLERAQLLARSAMAELRSPTGSFYDARDNPHAPGGLRERTTSILDNAVMAEALIRLGHMTRDATLRAEGRRTLASFLDDYRRYGHHVAAYARAVNLLVLPPVHVTIVGPRRAERTLELRRAALRPYVANRIVQTVDPDLDQELFARTGLPRPSDERVARAYVDQGQESYAETSRPERLPALMARTERSD